MRSYPFDDQQLQGELAKLASQGIETAEVTLSLNGQVVRSYQVPTAPAIPPVEATGWETVPVNEIAELVLRRALPTDGDATKARRLIVIDGDAGSGKSTFTRALATELPNSAVVAVDDVTWHYDILHWTDAMLTGVIEPWLGGRAVDYRPPGWVAKNRPGSIAVPADTQFLIIEGMTAIRPELLAHQPLAIFVSSDPDITWERTLGRDLGINGEKRSEVYAFNAWFQHTVVPYIMNQAPWEHAALLVDGTAVTPANHFNIIEQR